MIMYPWGQSLSQKNYEVGKLPWASVNSFLKLRGLEYKNSKMASLLPFFFFFLPLLPSHSMMHLLYHDSDGDGNPHGWLPLPFHTSLFHIINLLLYLPGPWQKQSQKQKTILAFKLGGFIWNSSFRDQESSITFPNLNPRLTASRAHGWTSVDLYQWDAGTSHTQLGKSMYF